MTNKIYTVQIDSVGNPDTFRWSDGGDFVVGVSVRIPWWSMLPYFKRFWKGQPLEGEW